MIYLDNAATTLQKPASVTQAVLTAMKSCANPGRGGHTAALRAAEIVYRTRECAAALFDCEPEQVVFTQNATHALNLAIGTLVAPSDRVVVSGFEHNAVVRPLSAAGANMVVASTALFDPAMTLEGFAACLRPGTKLCVVNHVSNVFGYVQPVEQIAALCREREIPLIIDASQSAGLLSVSLRKTQAAFIAMPGHKGLYGPQGTGLLLCARTPKPLLFGGTGTQSLSQQMPTQLPERAEAGTLNVHGIAGLRQGILFVQQNARRILRSERAWKEQLCRGMAQMDGIRLFSGNEQTGVISFQPKHMDCEQLAGALAARGIAVRAGLHCAPLAHRSIGTLEDGTVRVSLGAFNTPQELRQFLQVLRALLRQR